MFEDGQCNLNMINLNNYQWSNNLREYFNHLLHDDDAQDVTIITDNHNKVQAHRIVLQCGSLFFRDILNNVGSNILYLRGVDQSCINYILEFVYTGKATIAQDKLEQFMRVSIDLKIVGIYKADDDVVLQPGETDSSHESSQPSYSDINRDQQESYVNMNGLSGSSSEEYSHEYDSLLHIYDNLEEHKLSNDVESTEGEGNSDDKLFVKFACDLCDKTFLNKSNLKLHRYKFHTREKILQKSLIAMT